MLMSPRTEEPVGRRRREMSARRSPRALILVENESVPHDRRVMQEARSLVEAGYGVSVICPADPGERSHETLEGVIVRRYRQRKARGGALSQVAEYANALVRTAWHMAALARRPGFDVVQACNPPDLFFALVWPYALAGKRFVFDQHDLTPELYATLYGKDSGAVLRVLRWCERRSYRLADAVIATNGSYKELACTRGGVAEDRVFVVRNGPKEGWPLPVAADASLRRGRRFLVVYVGVMGRQDGVDVLLQAVAELVHVRGFTDAHFALVGSGDALDSLVALAGTLGIADHVEFTGWVRDEEILSRYLVTADACVAPEPSSPLNDRSTFIKVMEYLAAGAPVVAFDLPETRVSAGEAALYAEPGDTAGFAALIERALLDEGLRTRLREAATSRLPALRWEAQVPALLAAYSHALGYPRPYDA